MDEEWEEEEQLVVVELSGIINSDFLMKAEGKCKIVGIDTDQPMMQVGRYVFAGEYEDLLGTCVIFEEAPDCGEGPSTSPKLNYKCHTVKKLMMQRTFLSENKEGEPSSGGIEVLQLSDREISGRNGKICNFVRKLKGAPGEMWDTDRKDDVSSPSLSSESDSEEAGVCCQDTPGSVPAQNVSDCQEAGSITEMTGTAAMPTD